MAREGGGGGWEGREHEEAFEWLSLATPWVVWFPMATKFGQAARLACCMLTRVRLSIYH